jgi:hypothetical protein
MKLFKAFGYTYITFSGKKQFSGFEFWELIIPLQEEHVHILGCQKKC